MTTLLRSPSIQIAIDGELTRVYDGIEITQTLEALADSFTLNLTDSDPDSDSSVGTRVGGGAVVQIYFGDTLILTGFAEVSKRDLLSSKISASGRSKAGRAVSFSPGILGKGLSGQSLQQAATALLAPFKNADGTQTLGFVAEDAIARRRVGWIERELDEAVGATLQRIARYLGVRLTSLPDGNISAVQFRKGTKATRSLTSADVKNATMTFDFTNLPSEIRAWKEGTKGLKAQGGGGLEAFKARASSGGASEITSGSAKNNILTYDAPTSILADQAAGLSNTAQAAWEMTKRLAQAFRAEVEIAGLLVPDEDRLWKLGEIVRLDFPEAKTIADFAIMEIHYSDSDARGSLTRLKLSLAGILLDPKNPLNALKGKKKLPFKLPSETAPREQTRSDAHANEPTLPIG